MKCKSALMVIVSAASLLSAAGCVGTPVEDETEDTAEVTVIAPDEALSSAVVWLREAHPADFVSVPEEADWGMEGPDELDEPVAGRSEMRAHSGEWNAVVTWAVVAPEHLNYWVELRNPEAGWYWEGSVSGISGAVTERTELLQMTEETAATAAADFVRNSPTFQYDGIEETFEPVAARKVAGTDYSWVFFFRFDSLHAGYGDRTGRVIAEAITPHRVIVEVQKGEVVSGVIDETWDMLTQMVLEGASVGDVPLPYAGAFRPIGPSASERLAASGGGCSSCG